MECENSFKGLGFGIQRETLTVAILCKETIDKFVRDLNLSSFEDLTLLAKTVARLWGEDENLDWSIGVVDQELCKYLQETLSDSKEVYFTAVGGESTLGATNLQK